MPVLLFAPFQLDPQNAQVWRGTQPIALTPKAFAVLHYLVAHAGQLVTKDTLFDVLWPGTAVGDAALTVCIGEIRKALGDAATAPQFITTVRRRGYRFSAPVTVAVSAPAGRPGRLAPRPAAGLVGRDAALHQLHGSLAHAVQGARQIVMVTGEPGIGKTALLDTFLAHAEAVHQLWVAHGQCIEAYGTGEAYLPVLEALGRLCHGPAGASWIARLRHLAPTWLVQMPWLLRPGDREALHWEVGGATRNRMLRELAACMEAGTATCPLILVLEDLQWSDAATLDAIALLAQRQEPARLLLLGTYRPAEGLGRDHPMRRMTSTLQRQGHGTELALPRLDAPAVSAYLAVRCPGHTLPGTVASFLYQRTDGNPLFMVQMVEALLAQGVLRTGEGQWSLTTGLDAIAGMIPTSLQQMLERQIMQLTPEEQQVLAVASVAGVEFATALVAAGLGWELDAVEEVCERVARRQQVLGPVGVRTWPDGTVAMRYAFCHGLYQEVVYQRSSAVRRMQWHQRLGARLEAAYRPQTDAIAAELAMHFAQGRDYPRALPYLQQAGDNALRRSAHQAAITHLTTAVQILETLPDTPERTRRAVALHLALGNALTATHGSAAPETGAAFRRAYTLSAPGDDPEQAFNAVRGLALFHTLRGEPTSAQALGEHLLRQTHHSRQAILRLEAHRMLGGALLWQGQVRGARDHLEQALALYEPQHRVSTFLYGIESGVASRILLSLALWVLGYPAQARQQNHAAMTLAQELAHPLSLAYARTLTAMLYQWRRESTLTHHWTETTIALTTEHGFPQFQQTNASLRGWALVQQGRVAEGLTTMRQSLAAWQAMGANLYQPYLLALLAEAHARLGQIDAGFQRLEDALAVVDATGEGLYAAELYRVHGDLLRVHPSTPPRLERAEVSLHRALAIARQQQAKAWELRAATSLARLWQQQGKQTDASARLAPIYGWFTEGFDTADLQDAKALLEALGG